MAEHELIEVEKLFGQALNIPIVDEENPTKTQQIGGVEDIAKDMESRKISSDRFKDKLLQWRLLFFLHDIQDRTLSDIAAGAVNDDIYLHLKLFDFVTSIKIYNKLKPFDSPRKVGKSVGATPMSSSPRFRKSKVVKDRFLKRKTEVHTDKDVLDFNQFMENAKEYMLKKMRVHYFFTEKEVDLDDFISNTQIEIRITDGPNWNKVISKATCSPLIHFKVLV